MARLHRSKSALSLVAIAACGGAPALTTRTVTMRAPGVCAPGGSAVGLDGGAYAMYSPEGDFDPLVTSAAGDSLGRVGDALPEIDDACRELVVNVTEGDNQWSGLGEIPPTGDIDVLLLPWRAPCSLAAPVGPRSAATLAPVGNQQALLVGGDGANSSSGSAPTLVVHLDDGSVEQVTTDLLTPRVLCSVTMFGGEALVAGGVDPRAGGSALGTAEVYRPLSGDFDQQHPILLSAPRANHGAIVLATGETLLVGGVGGDGQTVLASMEVVDPVTRTVRSENVAQLAAARRAPSVVRLASGEILVAGGLDGAGQPVALIEWFAPDATVATKRPRSLVAGAARAYAALGAGGAIAVVTAPPGAPSDFDNVWVIDADGALEAAPSISGALTQPVLFGGAGGAPALWTGDRWLRWQPWTGSFADLGVGDLTPVHVGAATASPDPGLALWVDDDASLFTALRFDVRDTYSPLASPLLVSDAENVAPDVLPAAGQASFDPAEGMVLGPGASAFVTDRTYADVEIAFDAPTSEPALLVLRDELGNEVVIGAGGSCPGPPASTAPSTLRVLRRGSGVTWSAGADSGGACAGPLSSARVSVGLRTPAQSARSVTRNLIVTRLGER